MTGKSGRGTARQTFRFATVLWDWFGEHTGNQTRTDVLKQLILWWMHAGELPQRPATSPPRNAQVQDALDKELGQDESEETA